MMELIHAKRDMLHFSELPFRRIQTKGLAYECVYDALDYSA
jgi:hypothetical protein